MIESFQIERPAIRRALLVLFALWALWLCAPFVARGPLSYLKIHSNADSHVSFQYWLKAHAECGFAARLHPVMGGTDRVADYGIPSLFDYLAMLVPVQGAYVLMMFLQRFIGTAFTFLFLRRVFGIGVPWAAAAGLAFSLGLTRGTSTGAEWVFFHFLQEPGFPLLLYAFCRLPLTPWRPAALRFAALGLLMAMTMNLEIGLLFTLPCAYLFALMARADVRRPADALRLTALVFLAGLMVLLYLAPHLWAAVLNSPESSRAIMQAQKRTYGWASLRVLKMLQAMAPQALLALVWLVRLRWRARREVALLVLLLLTFVGGWYARPFGQQLWTYFPFLSGFFFDRLALYGPFCLICAAALGLSRLPWPQWTLTLRGLNGERTVGFETVPALIICLLIAQASLWVGSINLERSFAADRRGESWHRLYRNPELRSLAERIGGRPLRTVTVGAGDDAALWQPAFNIAYGLETADGFKNIYPWRYHRFWRQVVDVAYRASDDNLTHAFMDVSGYRMFLFPQKPGETLTEPPYNLNLLSLANVGYFISQRRLDDPRLTLLPQVYTQARINQWAARALPGKINGLLHDDYVGDALFVYENPEVMPRFFCAAALRVSETEAGLLDALRTASLAELKAAVFCETRDCTGIPRGSSGCPPGRVEVLSYTLEKSRLRVAGDAAGFLVHTSTYYPFWTCRVDGQPARVFPAYETFMAVAVPAGIHTVEWEYQPPYARWTAVMGLRPRS